MTAFKICAFVLGTAWLTFLYLDVILKKLSCFSFARKLMQKLRP